MGHRFTDDLEEVMQDTISELEIACSNRRTERRIELGEFDGLTILGIAEIKSADPDLHLQDHAAAALERWADRQFPK